MKARKERHGGPEPRGMLVLKKAGGQEMTLTQEGILFANCCHGTKGPCLSCAQLLILSSSYLKEAKKSPDFPDNAEYRSTFHHVISGPWKGPCLYCVTTRKLLSNYRIMQHPVN